MIDVIKIKQSDLFPMSFIGRSIVSATIILLFEMFTHTEMTIDVRGSMTRNLRSFDVVAMYEPSRFTANE